MLTSEQLKEMHALSLEDTIKFWDQLEGVGKKQGKLLAVVRFLCLNDLYYLLVRACHRNDLLHQFFFERTREVESNPDGHLDLWAREHGKSSVVSFGLTIQDILKNPDITFGIFSHTRPIAKAFLRQIMRELEENETLSQAFPDVLWGKDIKSAPKWSEDDGLIVRRKGNPKEATIEAWGLIDGQPTSKHFSVLLYDDVVVQASVTTPEQIEKTMTALEQSYNLGVTPGGKRRMVGTRWHYNDAHRTVVDRQTFKVREYPGRKGGTEDGESVYWPEETHLEKRRDMGPHTYAAQILLNPKADALQGFKRDWMRYYKNINAAKMNKYLLVDAAASKKRRSDYTSMWIIGLGSDQNYYVLDMVRDRLNLTERADRVFAMHRKWRPLQTRYERYGMQGDIEHIKARQEAENYRFDVTEVAGQMKKEDRIGRLIPVFEQGRFYFPETLNVANYEKIVVDLVKSFVEEEFVAFPVGIHDDMMDALSRIAEPDLSLVWPMMATVRNENKRVVRSGWAR